MGLLGSVFESVVSVLRDLGVFLAILLSALLWAAPNGMLPETKFIILTTLIAVVYDGTLNGGSDFGPGDLVLSSGLAFGTLVVVN